MKTPRSEEQSRLDRPVRSFDGDRLNRKDFAENIFKIVQGTPRDLNIRLGINGDWGSGKTTVLNYIKNFCSDAGYPCADFNPWHFQSAEKAWEGFALKIDAGLAAWKDKKSGNVRRQQQLKTAAKAAKKAATLFSSNIGNSISDLLLDPLCASLVQNKKEVQGLICKELDSKNKNARLFILIDDLDRANPDILYSLLMFLNEVVDLDRCVFVIAYDLAVAAQIIESKSGVKDGKEFLEKIINWSFDLPAPSDFDWKDLIAVELRCLESKAKKRAIDSIFKYLPQNPRKLKYFLRLLTGLHEAFLNRFDDDELNWELLYLIQLVKVEFPFEANNIFASQKLIEALAHVPFQNLGNSDSTDEGKEPEWSSILKLLLQETPGNHERLKTLVQGIADCCGFELQERIAWHIKIIETPELLTRREYREHKRKILELQNPEERKGLLRKILLPAQTAKQREISRSFLKALLADRNEIFHRAISTAGQEEICSILPEVHGVMTICGSILEIDAIFEGENPIFDSSVFADWCEKIVEYVHFKEDIYKEKIDDEEKVAVAMCRKIGESQVSAAANIVVKMHDSPGGISKKDERSLAIAMYSALESRLAVLIFKRFERSQGIQELYTSDCAAEKKAIFSGSSILFSEGNIAKLKELAQQASMRPVIWENFFYLIEMAFNAVTGDGGHVGFDAAKLFASHEETQTTIWGAVISRKMNRRYANSLEQKCKPVRRILKDDNAFKFPPGWQDLISGNNVD